MTRERVLIIDDNELDRRLSTLDLEAAGYIVYEAGNATEGAELMEHQPIDLIILDIVMPGLDGLTFLRELRRHPRTMTLPVIMLTARDEIDDELGAMADGALSYIVKPSHREILVKNVEKALLRTERASGDD